MNTNLIKKNTSSSSIFILMLMLFFGSCTPERINEQSLDANPGVPDFTVEAVADNPNLYVVKSNVTNAFQVLWDIPGGVPKSSVKTIDTISFPKAGVYKVTFFATFTDGSGTSIASKTVNIAEDAPLTCSPKFALLTGDCTPAGKCWGLTAAAGAVRVGPTYDQVGEWFTSTAGSLQTAQYDDRFCFTFDGFVFENRNNGASVNPWDGYKVQTVNFGISDFTFTEGTGTNGRDQITLQNDQFMGVWDADNVLDVMKLSKDELVVRTKLRDPSGTPAAEGWFELTFIPN
jgi:hypothetical protein